VRRDLAERAAIQQLISWLQRRASEIAGQLEDVEVVG